MRPYVALLQARISILLQYRAAAFAGFLTQVFWGIIKVMILTAFYAQAAGNQPLTLEQAVTFIWIGQALLGLLPWRLDQEVEAQVKNGNVAYEMVRPLDIYWLWFARGLAARLVPTVLRSIPLFIAAVLFFDLNLPSSTLTAAAFLCSIFASALLSAAITTLVVVTLFWTISGEGIQRLLPHFTVLLAGVYVPLPLFPSWMRSFLEIQPFRCIIDIPCRLYTGVIALEGAPFYIGFQLLWVLIIVGVGRFLLRRAMKQFVVQGG